MFIKIKLFIGLIVLFYSFSASASQELIDAACSGDLNKVNTLINSQPHSKLSAFVNFQNEDSESALHCAASMGHVDVVKALLNAGARRYIEKMHKARLSRTCKWT